MCSTLKVIHLSTANIYSLPCSIIPSLRPVVSRSHAALSPLSQTVWYPLHLFSPSLALSPLIYPLVFPPPSLSLSLFFFFFLHLPFLARSLLPHSLPSGLACSFLSISTLGKTREGKRWEEATAGPWGLPAERRRGDRRGESEESEVGRARPADLPLLDVRPLTNGCLMTWD